MTETVAANFAVMSNPLKEDLALVERMLGGDEKAFDEFAERYFPGLYRFAMGRLGRDEDLSLDIVQTTLCKAIAKPDSYRGAAPLFGWLCACCRNEIGMHFRRKRREPNQLDLDNEISEPIRDEHRAYRQGADLARPDQTMFEKEEASLVHQALDSLPLHYAKVLDWKYLDKISVREIGERLDVGPKAAESLLTRARVAFGKTHEQLSREREPSNRPSVFQSGATP